MLYSVANLKSDTLEAVQSLENELGKTLIAFSKLDVEATRMTRQELVKLQALEEELDVCLVAVRAE